MSQIPARHPKHENIQKNRIKSLKGDYVALTPDFPFDYKAYLDHYGAAPLGTISPENKGKRVAIIGAGVAGMIAAYEAMRMGLVPIIFEANDRIGGRFYSERFEDAESPENMPVAELGAMRFSEYSKSLVHYFKKAGMWDNTVPFPNPGSGWVPGNLVDFRGELNYYEVDPATGGTINGTTNEYAYLADKFYGDGTLESGLMERNGLKVSQAWDWQMAGDDGVISEESKIALRNHWHDLLKGVGTKNNQSFDTKSFRDLFTDDGWSFEDIEAFGQVGFGTGGWGTDYIDSSVEVLRVIYMGLDTDQRLMLDGADRLPNTLFTTAPSEFGDDIAGDDITQTLEKIQADYHYDGSIFNKEVCNFIYLEEENQYSLLYRHSDGHIGGDTFDAVVYTPHVRVLDKFRYYLGSVPEAFEWEYYGMNDLFDQETWEAIEYTHYQQSTKIFQVVDSAFWNERDLDDNKYQLCQTLSDKITRGTYLVDYSDNSTAGGNKGVGVFSSYTWADDSAKFLSSDNDEYYSSWGHVTTTCLDGIYKILHPEQEFLGAAFRGHADGQPSASKKWDDDPHYIMAFKYNLPGQYRYQKSLFQNFFCAPSENAPDTRGFILAGDGISWTAAWAEGAVQSALNAVSKLEYLFNGNESNLNSPHGQYLTWQPIDIPDPGSDVE